MPALTIAQEGRLLSPAEAPARRESTYRPDIEGLRAVAVLLIVGFHVALPGFAGGFIGVDVFFVISGYLITQILLRWIDGTEEATPLMFWARRIRRLVPALSVVIVAVVAVGIGYIYSPLLWHGLSRQAAASALYVSNILFARQATDYFSPDIATSPFLHTWSLGVEEQFYVVWPLLFLVPARIARRSPQRARRLLVPVLTAITAASFLFSFVLSQRGSPWAFFSSPARAWEFGAGGLVAIIISTRTLRSPVLWPIIGWLGLAAIVVATVTLDDRVPYPGVAALAPVLGTLALLLPSDHGARSGPATILRWPPLRWIGRVSYSWYLWHWPLIVYVEVITDGATTTERLGAAVLALALAEITRALIEDPIRFGRLVASTRRAFLMGIALTAMAVLTSAGVTMAEHATRHDALLQRLRVARQFDKHLVCKPVEDDMCVFGDPAGARTLVLVGDSHAMHWIPAIDLVAQDLGFRLVVSLRGGCPLVVPVTSTFTGRRDSGCDAARADTMRQIATIHPAAVIVATDTGYSGRILSDDGRVLHGVDELNAWQNGYTKLLQHLEAQHVPVIVAVDPPTLGFDPVECIARHRSVSSCTPSRDDALRISQPFNDSARASLREANYGSLYDTTNIVCQVHQCALEIQDVLVYADADHITYQFSLEQAARWRTRLTATLAGN